MIKKLFGVLAAGLLGPARAEPALPAHCQDKRQLMRLPKTCRDGKRALELLAPSYVRIHPTGNFAIATVSDETVIFDLRKPDAIRCATVPLSKEAYPVEPSWDMISGRDLQAMIYYSFTDLLAYAFPPEGSAPPTIEPVIKDTMYNQLYQSHGTIRTEALPGGGEKVTFRSVYFTHLFAQDLSYIRKDGKLTAVSPRTMGAHDLQAQIPNYTVLPILSKDGRYFAGLSEIKEGMFHTKIYELQTKADGTVGVKEVNDLKIGTGKLSFEYPPGDRRPRAVYRTELQVKSKFYDANMLFDPSTGKTRLVSYPWLEKDASIPGFTADGHVMYTALQGEDNFMVKLDANAHSPDQDFSDCFSYEQLLNGGRRGPAGTGTISSGSLDPREFRSQKKSQDALERRELLESIRHQRRESRPNP